MSTFTPATQPTSFALNNSIDKLAGILGNTQIDSIDPPMRDVIIPEVVDQTNFRELALAEIERQNIAFGSQFESGKIPVSKQAAILTAFQIQAGVPSAAVRPDQLALLQRNQEKLSLENQTAELISRANNFAKTTVEVAGDFVEFVSSPFGIVVVAAGTIAAAVILIKV